MSMPRGEDSRYNSWLRNLQQEAILPSAKIRADQLAKQTVQERLQHSLEVIKVTVKNDLQKEMGPQPFNSEGIKGMCGTYCTVVYESLRIIPWIEEVQQCESSPNPEIANIYAHRYIQLQFEDNVSIILDPTLGQYVKDYNTVFIGTRQELKDIILNSNAQLINIKFAADTPENRLDFFNKVWGETAFVKQSSLNDRPYSI